MAGANSNKPLSSSTINGIKPGTTLFDSGDYWVSVNTWLTDGKMLKVSGAVCRIY